jgi:manganese/zinc/iron transport system permease protein
MLASLTPTAEAFPSLRDIAEVLTFRAGHNTTVVLLGVTLLGIAGGVVGVFALLRKRALMADALSHATLPGVALAFLVAVALGFSGRSLPVLLLGGAITGVMGVLCVQALLRFSRLREDAAIGIVLSVFFGVGVVLLSVVQNSPSGNAAGLNHFIYGQTAAMRVPDAILMGAIAAGSVVLAIVFLKEFAVVCFNDAFAKVGGWPVSIIDLVMMALVVVVVVAGLQAVGLILVIAMLILPPVAARFWTERLWLLVVLAGVIGGLSGYFGATISALLPRKPAGSVIVLTSGVIFAFSMFLAPSRGVLASMIRRFTLRLHIARDHLLETAHDHGGTLAPDGINRLASSRGWRFGLRSIVLRSSRALGLVTISNGAVSLTDAGRAAGARISRNHRLWEEYLIQYADIAPTHVDWSVDQVEHVLSEELIARLEAALIARGVTIPPHGGDA